LGVPLGSPSFVFFFLQDALDDDVCHVEELLSLRNILAAFGSCFDVSFIYTILFFKNPFLEFQHQLAYFDLTFIQILGLSFLECLEVFFKINCQQDTFLGISKEGKFHFHQGHWGIEGLWPQLVHLYYCRMATHFY